MKAPRISISFFLFTLLMAGVQANESACAQQLAHGSSHIDCIKSDRIAQHCFEFKKSLRNDRLLRIALVGGAGVCGAAIAGYLTKRFFFDTSSDANQQTDVHQDDTTKDAKVTKELLEFLRKNKENANQSFWTNAKNYFFATLVSGLSVTLVSHILSGFGNTQDSLWSSIKKIWNRDEQFYFNQCKQQVAEQASQMQNHLFNLMKLQQTERQNVVSSVLFLSFLSSIKQRFQMVVYSAERLLGLIRVLHKRDSIEQETFVIDHLNAFAQELSNYLDQFQADQSRTIGVSLMQAWAKVSDSLVFVIQQGEAIKAA